MVGSGGIAGAGDWLAGGWAGLLDPVALGLVVGGAILIAMVRASRRDLARALAALGPLVRADPDADAEAAAAAVARVRAIAEVKHIVCVDRAETTGRFLADAVAELSDARAPAEFERWADATLAARRRRHAAAIAVWASVADAAPAMGMIATVLGLIRMFAGGADPARLGAPMATALVATLFGLLLANAVAGPIADRLARLSDAELAWQRDVARAFAALAHAEIGREGARPAPGFPRGLRKVVG